MGPIASQGRSVNTHAADCSSSRSSHTRHHRASHHDHSARRRTHPRGSATQQRAARPYRAVLLGRSTPGRTSLATPSRSPVWCPVNRPCVNVCRSPKSGGEVREKGPKKKRSYFEECMEALFCSLFLEAFLLFRTEVTGLFGLLYLVEHGFELNCRSQSRHAVRMSAREKKHRRESC